MASRRIGILVRDLRYSEAHRLSVDALNTAVRVKSATHFMREANPKAWKAIDKRVEELGEFYGLDDEPEVLRTISLKLLE